MRCHQGSTRPLWRDRCCRKPQGRSAHILESHRGPSNVQCWSIPKEFVSHRAKKRVARPTALRTGGSHHPDAPGIRAGKTKKRPWGVLCPYLKQLQSWPRSGAQQVWSIVVHQGGEMFDPPLHQLFGADVASVKNRSSDCARGPFSDGFRFGQSLADTNERHRP